MTIENWLGKDTLRPLQMGSKKSALIFTSLGKGILSLEESKCLVHRQNLLLPFRQGVDAWPLQSALTEPVLVHVERRGLISVTLSI
jgi:hypothetical protein